MWHLKDVTPRILLLFDMTCDRLQVKIIGRGGDPTRTNWTGKIPPKVKTLKYQHCQSSFGQSWNADILTIFAAFILVSAVKIWGRLIDILCLKILFFWMGLLRGGNFSSSFCPGGVTSSPYGQKPKLFLHRARGLIISQFFHQYV